MNELKYIIVIPPGFNEQLGARAIIFNGLIVHKEMIPKGFKCFSAGFLTFTFNLDLNKGLDGGVYCYGKSESIGIKSCPAFDAMIIKRTLTRTHPAIGFIKEEAHKSA